jgi:hypothetical protein
MATFDRFGRLHPELLADPPAEPLIPAADEPMQRACDEVLTGHAQQAELRKAWPVNTAPNGSDRCRSVPFGR